MTALTEDRRNFQNNRAVLDSIAELSALRDQITDNAIGAETVGALRQALHVERLTVVRLRGLVLDLQRELASRQGQADSAHGVGFRSVVSRVVTWFRRVTGSMT